MKIKNLVLLCAVLASGLFGCKSITTYKSFQFVPENTVMFTFDDGPNERVTPQLLDVLKKYDVNAVFVLLGVNAEKNTDIVKRIKNEGHYIVNHGYEDEWAIFMNDEKFKTNLEMGEAAITKALGEKLKTLLYRPHGGFFRIKQESICNKEGYKILGANIRTYDSVKSSKNKKTVIKKIILKTAMQKGGIILLHDARGVYSEMENELLHNPNNSFNRDWIPSAVEEIILQLRERGFTLWKAY
ncbi:MAG: hypothetical protein Ta2F_05020 [Termitinemataceae bacterium]|nr:MAG: hypothetical protein Ta2F_05020 [Termitinemataceae bacterium]